MTLLVKPLESIKAHSLNILFKLRRVLIGLMAIGLGVLIGYLGSSSSETAELTVSIVVIITLMLIIINRPLNGLLVLLMMMPFLEEWVEIPLGAGIPDLSFSRFAIAFLAIFMLAKAAIEEFRFATPISLAEIAIVATTIGLLSAAALIDGTSLTIQQILAWHCVPLLMYFLARNLVRNRDDLHKLFGAIAIFGFAAASYAIYESSTGHVLFVPKGTDVSELNTSYSENLWLLRGLLDRTGMFGRTFLSTIPVTFYLLFENKNAVRRILLIGMLIIQFYAMFLTYNRTSWYALMAGLFILQIFYPQFRKVYIVIVFVAALVLWVTWDQVNDSELVEKRINSKTSTLEKRQTRWQAAYSMWKVKPIRGWGFEAFQNESGRFRTDGRRENFTGVENNYLYIMAGSGLVGFLPYLIFLLAPLINSLRLFFRARAPGWSGFIKPETIAIYWAAISGFAIGSYSMVINVPIVKMIPFAMAGAIVGTHQLWLSSPDGRAIPQSPPAAIASEKTRSRTDGNP